MTWKEHLPDTKRRPLEQLLLEVENNENAYRRAENPSIGQIWVALAEMNRKMQKMEETIQAQRKALNQLNVDVDKQLDEDLKKSLKKY